MLNRNERTKGFLPNKVAIFWGQSNMGGGNFDTDGQSRLAALGSGAQQGWLYPPTAGVDNGIQIWTPNQGTVNNSNVPVWTTGTTTGRWTNSLNGWTAADCTYPACPAYPTTSSTATQTWGPEAQWAWMWRQTFPKVPIWIIKPYMSGTQLATNGSGTDWNPANSGKLFDYMVDVCSKALAALANPQIIVFNTMQGENDAQDATNASNYQTNFGNFMSAVNSRINGGTATNFCIGRITTNWSNATAVRAAQTFWGTQSNCTTVNTDSYPLQGDNIHYTQVGQTCSVATQGVMPASGGLGSDMFNNARTAGFF